MGIIGVVIMFLVWCIGTIKTESRNVNRYYELNDKDNMEKSANSVVVAAIYLGMFVLLILAALVM